MKSKLEINYLPEDKQYSTEKKEKESSNPFLYSLYIFVCFMEVVGDNLVKYRVSDMVYLNLNNS